MPYLPVRWLFWLPVSVSALLVVLALAALVVVSWRGLARLEPIHTHQLEMRRLQDLALSMEQSLFRGLRGKARITQSDLIGLREEVRAIAQSARGLHPQTPEGLRRVSARLAGGEGEPVDALFRALAELRPLLEQEWRLQDHLLANVAQDTHTELQLSVTLLVALPFAGGLALFLLRRRLKQPLDNLGDLLLRLSARDYRPVPEATVSGTDSLVQPVFRSYNEMVLRLQALEAEHESREHILEREVRKATEALLAQSRQLARSERLAAVGAVSAGLAHELRNPLAGIQMACSKLRRTVQDADQAARLDAVGAELRRLARLLSDKVDAARHAPEPLHRVHLRAVVKDFLALVRYQLPEGISLGCEVPQDLVCMLPEAGVRQALLNLVLNAAQAAGASGTVTVQAHRDGRRLSLRVHDDGPGFSEHMLKSGVRPFSSGRLGGTGLGLAMVRRFAQELSGEMVLENVAPHGACVTLRLPCGSREEQGEGEADA
jgi:two-component system NtrC family sensor kinase